MDQERDIRGAVAVVLHLLAAQREAIPGVPGAGPYPATVDEVAAEIADFVLELERSGIANGLAGMVRDRLEAGEANWVPGLEIPVVDEP